MNQKVVAPRTNLREAYLNAAGPATFSNRALLLLAIPSILVVLTNNPTRLGGELRLWVFLSVAAYLASVLVLLAFKRVLYPTGTGAPKPVLTSLAMIVAGLARGFTAYFIGVWLGLVPPEELGFRLWSAVFLVYGALATFGIFVGSRYRHERVLAELAHEKSQLDELRGGIRERIRNQQRELSDRVQQALIPTIERVRAELNLTGSNSAIASLRDAVENVVRPLSHDVGLKKIDTVTTSTKAITANQNRFRTAMPRYVSVGSMFVPQLLVFAMMSIVFPAIPFYPTQVSWWSALITLPFIYFSAVLLRKIFLRVTMQIALAFVFVMLLMAVIAVVNKYLLMLLNDNVSWELVINSYMALATISAIIFFMQAIRSQRQIAEQQMTAVVADLALLNSQLRQELWLNQRRIASVLHGPIQAALYSAAMRLSRTESISTDLISSIEQDIEAALYKLEQNDNVEDFSATLDQIKNVWEGVTDVSVEVQDESIFEALQKNPVAGACAVEVIREAVSNAAKHGEAANVVVSLERSTPQLLGITVSNDGHPLSDSIEAGYGSSILDEVAFSWSLENKAGFTVLSAGIAL